MKNFAEYKRCFERFSLKNFFVDQLAFLFVLDAIIRFFSPIISDVTFDLENDLRCQLATNSFVSLSSAFLTLVESIFFVVLDQVLLHNPLILQNIYLTSNDFM